MSGLETKNNLESVEKLASSVRTSSCVESLSVAASSPDEAHSSHDSSSPDSSPPRSSSLGLSSKDLSSTDAASSSLESLAVDADCKDWHPLLLLSFRFVFCYFTLFNLDDLLRVVCYQLSFIPGIFKLTEPYRHLYEILVPFFGKAVFHLKEIPGAEGWAPADSTFGWLRVFSIFILSFVGVAGWSIIDRKRRNYTDLNKWFRLSLRIVLSQALVSYGMAKVIPTQFSPLTFENMSLSYSEETPMGLLWKFMGYSKPYSIFGGIAEVLPAIMLWFERTTLVAAMFAAAVMLNVVALNLCYDVRVKLYSLHLLAMALVLIVPEVPNLIRFFLQNRPTLKRTNRDYFARRWLNFAVVALPAVLGVQQIYAMTIDGLERYNFENRRSVHYGKWDVVQSTVNGMVNPGREYRNILWKALAFSDPDHVTLIPFEGETYSLFATLQNKGETLTLGQITNFEEYRKHIMNARLPFVPKWDKRCVHTFTITKSSSSQMKLKCSNYFGFDLAVDLRRVPDEKMPQLLRGKFRWITNLDEYGK